MDPMSFLGPGLETRERGLMMLSKRSKYRVIRVDVAVVKAPRIYEFVQAYVGTMRHDATCAHDEDNIRLITSLPFHLHFLHRSQYQASHHKQSCS